MEAIEIYEPAPQSVESDLAAKGVCLVAAARALSVNDNEAYKAAAEWLVECKKSASKIEDYWKPLKTAAKKAHSDICAKEKQMLLPIEEAIATVKGKMGGYQRAVEAEQRRREEEARAKAQEAAARLLEEAARKEADGNASGAETSLQMAQIVDEMAAPAAQSTAAPTADGVSVRKAWKARIVNPYLVPPYFNGLELRPVSVPVLNTIARTTKGSLTIPGVEFFEEATIAVRT